MEVSGRSVAAVRSSHIRRVVFPDSVLSHAPRGDARPGRSLFFTSHM
jgi:hypothetical protein